MMIGQVFQDRYELQELVGSGGMSSVYRAHDRLLDRAVALKILHVHHLQDPDSVRRFRQEARSVAVLSHPNIVTVIDRGEHDGRQFIVFEYVAGRNLKELILEGGRIPVERALELAIQVARGLSFAHRNGLVHRDVKPQNVLLNGDGEAKVTDFGIARSLTVQHGNTQTGTVLGTSDYVAPEQAQGKTVDEQSDVYALGVVLYELLTGDVPFPGDSFVAVAMRHINEPPPSVRAKRSDVSPRLDDAVRRAMAKDPADRFPTMADFGRELEAMTAGGEGTEEGTQVIPPPRVHRGRRFSPWPLVLVALGVLAAVAAVAYLLFVRGTGSTSGGSTPLGQTIALRSPTAYDPAGTGLPGENNQDAFRATDGSAGTYWPTEKYASSLASIHKPGVGLVLDAGSPVALRTLTLTTDTPGFTAEIKSGDSASSFPTAVSTSLQATATTRFSLDGGKHRYYLVWITDLGGNHTVHVNEVTAGD